MHVRIRIFGKQDTIVVVESKLTKIDQFRKILHEKFDVEPKSQSLFYGGKLLEDGYTFHDYNIKLNDVIQLMVRVQPLEKTGDETEDTKQEAEVVPENTVKYTDAESTLYEVGDLVDIRDTDTGSWLEAKITRIVYDPSIPHLLDSTDSSMNDSSDLSHCDLSNQSIGKENEADNKTPNGTKNGDSFFKSNSKGIAKNSIKYFKSLRKKYKNNTTETKDLDSLLLYEVKTDGDDSEMYCKLKDIRPRARTIIDMKDLKVGQKVMLNYNIDDPSEIGDWYDFEVANINKRGKTYELIGTLFLGAGAVPNDKTLIVKDNIYAIEEVVPLVERTKEYQQLMITPPKTRTAPLRCMSCRDDKDLPCKNCGCYVCAGKEPPEDIILCDECDKGFHLTCLTPPLEQVPKEDWYCVSCVRQPLTPIAPGAAKQMKKVTKTNRDWGRGMACVGKTKTCAMPPHHFGPIPGIEVGMSWRFRIQLSETGIHRPPVSGIHGRDKDGAYSIVLSGGYEDDVDNGNEFTYTGSGGRDLSGNKRTAGQSCDQTLTRENRALARNCNVKCVNENGGDAGDDWRKGKPVRVVRSCKMLKHFPEYAPMEGLRYDGIYKVVKYYPEKGLSGFRVWKYLLRRDDPSPAPWEPSAKKYPIIYPDGYLEAEAEKKALKEKNVIKGNGSIVKGKGKIEGSLLSKTIKGSVSNTECKGQKRMLEDTTVTSSEIESSPPLKKQKTSEKGSGLSEEERVAIEADTVNMNQWSECYTVCEERGKKEFIEYVTQMFVCIICHNVVMSPVTTPCSHNFCMVCLNQVIKKSGPQCPCCRKNLAKYEVTPNEELKTALRTIMPGYDANN